MIVLLPNCGFLSETTRMVAIARALAARGVPTRIATHGGPYEHVIDEAGLPWDRIDPPMREVESRDFLEGVLSLGRENRPLHSDEYLRAAVAAEADYLERIGARMAVIGFTLTAYVSTRLAGVALATSHAGSFVPPVLERGLCPAPVNPPHVALGRLPRPIQRVVANRIPPRLTAPVRDLNRIAAEMGGWRLPSFMALMCGDLTLVTELPETLGISTDELEAWRPRRGVWSTTRMRYAGPIYAVLDRPVPERVDRFLAAADEPVVYVCPTSVHQPFLRALVRAVRAAGVRVLVGATVHDVRDLEGEGILVEGVLPNHLVMPRVDAAVIMGGQGSVQTAMAAGTPFVGMPHHGEQELNVALAERLGVAIRLAPGDGASRRMTDAVCRVLADAGFRARSAEVQRRYAAADGAAAAADAIIAYLGDRVASGSPVP